MRNTWCAEADALRRTTLALTQNLSMDYVPDTLLQSLLKLVSEDLLGRAEWEARLARKAAS
ncbi:MAG: hypothetical protein WA641_04815 [Candidatus Acidiferrales bacterium]